MVRKLLGFVKNPEQSLDDSNNSEDRWPEKAIKSIIKKLKKVPGGLENLEKAVTNRDSNTECITFSRYSNNTY